MAKKWYRNLTEPSGDPRGDVRIGVDGSSPGAGPGEVFVFDYDRPGFNAQVLLDGGAIAEVDPSKEDLVAAAERAGVADAQKMTKDDLKATLEKED